MSTDWLRFAQARMKELNEHMTEGQSIAQTGIASAAALIAQVERMDTQNDHLAEISAKMTAALMMIERKVGSLADTDVGASVVELWIGDFRD